jgi:two-component system, chemotaxis family, protein-glutamate methylesterase/glutaminase
VIGTSWGGLDAVSVLLDRLHDDVHQPIIVAQHRSVESEEGGLARLLALHTRRVVTDPDDKTPLEADHVYISPPDYHVLVENGHMALSTEAPVQYARPSIDVLFESAAEVYREGVLAVLMTGASADGTMGAMRIKRRGGRVIVQDPRTAESAVMPQSAMSAGVVDSVLPLDEIAPYLNVAVVAHR